MSLFAKIDLELRDHPKASRAGAAMATWTWATLYSRAKELDGVVPEECLVGAWGGEKVARQHAAKLSEVGLFEPIEGGWKIVNFEKHNETKAAIEARRENGRKRVASFREKQVSNALHTQSPNAVVPGSGSDSGSDMDQDPDPTRGASPPDPAPDVPTMATIPGLVSDPPPWRDEAVATLAMTDPRRAPKPAEVGAHWLEFLVQRADAHVPPTPSGWLKWLTNAPRFAPKVASRLVEPPAAVVPIREHTHPSLPKPTTRYVPTPPRTGPPLVITPAPQAAQSRPGRAAAQGGMLAIGDGLAELLGAAPREEQA